MSATLADGECKREVEKKMVAAAGDIRQDTSLTLACKQDLTQHCSGVQPGGRGALTPPGV